VLRYDQITSEILKFRYSTIIAWVNQGYTSEIGFHQVNTSCFIKFNSASHQVKTSYFIKFSNCGIWSDFHQNQDLHPRAFAIIKFSNYSGALRHQFWSCKLWYINSRIWIGFSHLKAKYIQVSNLGSSSRSLRYNQVFWLFLSIATSILKLWTLIHQFWSLDWMFTPRS
jgi:hypothetical protein